MVLDLEKLMTRALRHYKSKILLLVCLLFIAINAHSQGSFLPENLGENINTTYAEINPVVSPDGKTLYFTKIVPATLFGELEKHEIWYSEKDMNGNWGRAKRMDDNLNIGRYNSVLAISGDGQTLLINGVYNKKGNLWRKRGLSVVKKEGDVWGAPVRLKVKKYSKQNKGLNSNASMSFDGNYLLLAFTQAYNRKNLNIYVSEKKGEKWKKPKKLGKVINTKRSEEAPFLSADNKKLYFSRKSKGSSSASDIYVATREGDNWKKWSKPEKLSDTINSVKWDSYFKTNMKGSEAYFSSENSSRGWSDIYFVKLFEENPFVLVKGKIINQATNANLLSNYYYEILADGKAIDSVKIHRDSASYSVKLPFGRKYSLSASVPNFTSVPQAIDLTNVKEHMVIEENLEVTPFPYVMVSGKVFQKGTNERLPFEAFPKIAIDGNIIDSLAIDSSTGAFSFQIPYGRIYKVKVVARSYTSVVETLDLLNVNEYKEITRNLYAELIKEKIATVKGLVIDKKVNKPFAGNSEMKLFVNGLETPAQYDTTTGNYVLELPLANTYTINASTEGYYPVFETIDLKNEKESIRVLKDLYIVPIEVGQSVRLNNIFFNPAKSTLQKASFPELDRVAQFLKENKNIVIEIGGHTDNIGKAASNMALSLGRAKAVEKYLLSKGVGKGQLSSKGYGVTKPVASNKTASGRAQNRRVEFLILNK